MDDSTIEIICIAFSLALPILYHVWYLLRTRSKRTITAWTIKVRRSWVKRMVELPNGGILAVQTLRNWILATTLLATACLSISIGILSFLGSASRLANTSPFLIKVTSSDFLAYKCFLLLFVYMFGFFCFANALRYFNHVGFSINVPMSKDAFTEDFHEGVETVEHVARMLNTANACFTIGMRFIYLSFPIFFWFFDYVLMVISSVVLVIGMYLGDHYAL